MLVMQFFHCTVWTIIAASFRRLFENESPNANLAIEITVGMTVPSWPSDSTHEHNFHNAILNFSSLMWWCLTSNKAEVHIDLCCVEPPLVNIYIIIHCVKTFIPRVYKELCEL